MLIAFCRDRGLVKGLARAPEIAEEDINVMFSTNVTGLINMTQAIMPIFKKRPDGGAGDIINVGSIAGKQLRNLFSSMLLTMMANFDMLKVVSHTPAAQFTAPPRQQSGASRIVSGGSSLRRGSGSLRLTRVRSRR
jgi:NAD(P)-dependent dehydrogenase (short-subunit alcohol dehydrogenase family)